MGIDGYRSAFAPLIHNRAERFEMLEASPGFSQASQGSALIPRERWFLLLLLLLLLMPMMLLLLLLKFRVCLRIFDWRSWFERWRCGISHWRHPLPHCVQTQHSSQLPCKASKDSKAGRCIDQINSPASNCCCTEFFLLLLFLLHDECLPISLSLSLSASVCVSVFLSDAIVRHWTDTEPETGDSCWT